MDECIKKSKNADMYKSKERTVTHFSLFDSKDTETFICRKGIKLLSENTVETTSLRDKSTDETTSEAAPKENLDILNDGKSCTLCGIMFTKLEEQRAHFKLDWHKYNIKQMLLQRETVKEDVFEEIISGDVSSISGSDSDSDSAVELETIIDPESNPLMTVSLLQSDLKENQENFMVDKSNPKIYFVNSSGNHMSVYRVVVFAAKDFLKKSEDVEAKIEDLSKERVWLILMTGGGHFAGAVFSGNDLVVRKTFHRYTVRAKRGTAQGIRDSKQGGHQPKSAGASLRRYNEAALVQDIQNLLESWGEHIEKCNRIFIRVPSNYKRMFFEGKKPPFKKDDLRIRTIPFATRRATFKEVQKAHQKLSTVEIHENYLTDLHKGKSKENCEISEKLKSQHETNIENIISESGDVNGDVNKTLETEQQEKINKDEEGQGDHKISNKSEKKSVKDEHYKKLSKKDNKDRKPTEKKKRQVIPDVWIELYEAVYCGNVEKVKYTVNEMKNDDEEANEILPKEVNSDERTRKDLTTDVNSIGNESCLQQMQENVNSCEITTAAEENDVWHQKMPDILNQIFEEYSETVLHLASRLGETDILKTLLDAGANPTVKDSGGRVPFIVAKDKETRSEFRRFMASYPAKFDYKKALIPSPLTAEMEEEKSRKAAEKKKTQSKARKQRLNKKKAEEKQREEEKLKREKEDKERNWFQNLSDREKRAIAAERRLGNICFNCSRGLQGLVPFERLSNKYCSTECVQKHRQLLETSVK